MLVQAPHGTSQLRSIVLDQCIRDWLQIAIYDLIEFIERQRNAMIGQAVFREVVGSNTLTAISRANQRAALFGAFFMLFLAIVFIQSRLEHPHGLREIFVLTAFVLHFDDDVGFVVRQADGRLGLVHMLTTGGR